MAFMGKDILRLGLVPLIHLLINHPHLNLAGNTPRLSLFLHIIYVLLFKCEQLLLKTKLLMYDILHFYLRKETGRCFYVHHQS